jgi:pimeloyl-ACP methyl ester carboxylesterase
MLQRVTSGDGTHIAFEQFGEGPPVILVGGATSDRAMTRPLAEELAQHFSAINYDRRGRGDSGDTEPYTIEREIEDLGVLIAGSGGTASVYGHSSGAGLALQAAAHGLPIARLALHEPPYVPDGEEERRISQEYGQKLRTILAEDRRGDAVALFMVTVGITEDAVEEMHNEPWWAGMEAVAPTLLYDSEVMGDISRGGTVPTDILSAVTMPTLVLFGGASPRWMSDVGRKIADGLPDGRFGVLEDQDHVVPPDILAPVLTEFFAG